jgi:hypothetical protein
MTTLRVDGEQQVNDGRTARTPVSENARRLDRRTVDLDGDDAARGVIDGDVKHRVFAGREG